MPLQDLFEKEVESRHAILHGAGRQLLIAQHMQLELADLLDAQLVGRLAEVGGKIPNGADIAANGAGRKVATLEFLQHALT